jgi:hypothetical protein
MAEKKEEPAVAESSVLGQHEDIDEAEYPGILRLTAILIALVFSMFLVSFPVEFYNCQLSKLGVS